ncbi:MAG: diguanylate cyclase [Proteobacteria bacterium]|nr:diguanylate cyclase [Pseudomonadota bacterium]NOG61761.1 diguanylate cyclase [Pseudomonadota bacterium]
MNQPQEKALLELQTLREKYAEKLPGIVKQIESEFKSQFTQPEKSSLEEIYRRVHSLSGSGATFGYTTISKTSRQLEDTIGVLLQKNTLRITKKDQATISKLINKLTDALNENPVQNKNDNALFLELTQLRTPELPSSRTIILIDDELEFCKSLSLQLSSYGYSVKSVVSLDYLEEHLVKEKPLVIIMDIMFPEGNLAGVDAISQTRLSLEHIPPVIFISQRDDLQARLAATRAGGSAYFSKPIDVMRLIDMLDQLISDSTNAPYRVLIIEDDEQLAYYNARLLEGVGIQTKVITDPFKLLEASNHFQPELIIMDLYLPGCDGIELAEILRQQQGYVGTQIIFYSIETNINKHLDALRAGGDDFLVKPLKPHYFVTAIEARAKRSRIVSSFMISDSLTGLYNHGMLNEHLQREFKNAMRKNESLIYAAIDLDHFKNVNDTHGHGAGDMVLISFSRLMRNRFRFTDLIGRYGGEEFSIILPNTKIEKARELLDELRINFSKIEHSFNKKKFTVTCSIGIASTPPCKTIESLQEAADTALYKAKKAGRNCVK